MVIGNRNDSSFVLPTNNDTNSFPQFSYADEGNITLPSTYPSDAISTFALNDDGTLSFVQLAPAGGLYPRHLSLNSVGNLLAVGSQHDNKTVVWKRDVATGFLGEMVASVPIVGNVTCVMWNEEKAWGVVGQ